MFVSQLLEKKFHILNSGDFSSDMGRGLHFPHFRDGNTGQKASMALSYYWVAYKQSAQTRNVRSYVL